MSNKIKIGWRYGAKGWAYHNIFKSLTTALNNDMYEHLENQKGDINFIFSFSSLGNADNRTILHLDSLRELRINNGQNNNI